MANEIQIVVTSEAHMDALRAAANDVNRLTQDELASLEQRKAARAAVLAAMAGQEQAFTATAIEGAALRTEAVKKEEAGTNLMSSALGRLGTVYGAVWAARRLINWGEDIANMAILAGQYDITASAFAGLALKWGEDGPAELAKLRASVYNTTSDLVLMQKAGAAVEAGLTFDQAKIAIEYLRNYSLAFGKDFETLMNSTMLSLESGTTRGLRQAGIIIDIHSKMFDGLDELQKKEMLVALAEEKMIQGRKDLVVDTENAVVKTQQLSAEWAVLEVRLGHLATGPVLFFVRALNNSLSGQGGAAMGYNPPTSPPPDAAAQAAQGVTDRAAFGVPEPQTTAQAIAALRLAGDAKIAADELKIRQNTLDQIGILEAKASDDRVALQTAEANKERDLLLGKVAAWKDADAQMKASAVARINSAIDAEIAGFQHAAALKAQKEQDAIDREWDAKMEAISKGNERLLEEQIKANEKMKAEAEKLKAHQVETYESMVDQIAVIAGRASITDPLKALEAEQTKFLDDLMKKAVEAKIPVGELLDLMNKLISAQDMERQKAVEHQTIHHVMLYFDANTQNVRDASDFAAYSIGLLTARLKDLDPAIKASIDSIQQIVVGASAKDPKGVAGISAGGWAGIISGGVGLLTTALDLFGTRAERNYEEWVKLQRAINAASEAGGEFAKTLEGGGLADLQRKYQADIMTIRGQGLKGPMMGDFENFGQVVIGSENLGTKAQEIANEINRLSEAIARFGGVPDTFQNALFEFNHLIRMDDIQDPAAKLRLLNEQIGKLSNFDLASLNIQDRYSFEELVASLQRDISAADIKARRDAAQTMIDAIHQQAADVQKALDDSLSAQQAAVLRAVGLTFDIQEMALRASFGSRIQGASTDPAEMTRIVAQIGREIEVFRSAEANAGTNELSKVRASIDAQKALVQQSSDMLAQAVTNAAQQTGVDFTTAVKQQTDSLLAGFADSLTSSLANTVLDPNNALDPHSIVNTNLPITPAELVALQNRIMIDMASVLNPVGVRPIELSAALQMQGIKDVDVQRALELQGLKFVNMESWFGLQNVKMVDLAQSLGLSGKQTVDLSDALRTQGTLNIQMPTALSTTGTKDVALSTALLLSGTKNASVTDVFTLTGGKSVDLATYLTLTGGKDVDLATALTLTGGKDVDLATYLTLTGGKSVDLATYLTLTGGKDVGLATALTLTGSKSVDLATALTTTGGTGIGDALTVLHTDNTLIAMWLAYIQTNTLRTADLVEGSWRWTAAKDTGTLTSAFVMGVGGTMMTRGAFQFPSFDVGGTVPGPAGAPMLAVVHGGETFSGVGGQLGGGLTVQAAPQGSPSVNINISTVNAYGTQSADDIRALYRATIEPEIVKSLTDGVLSKVIPR